MFKNVASQKLMVFAFDSTTNLPKTGDAANLTAYVSKDYGSVTALTDTSATEMDSTNAKGYYLFDLTQAETNADTLLFTCKSSTANIVIIGAPAVVFTDPTTGVLAPTVAGRTLDVSAGGEAGVDWANVGSPTTTVGLSGTTVKTATDVETDTQDIQSRLPAALTGDGNIKADTLRVGGTLQTAGDIIGDTNDIQTRLPAALVGGRIDASVGAVAANAITAASIASDAIDADALAADAITEIWAKACTEPTSVVAASPTALAALSWLLTLSRNKITQTSSAQVIKADDGSTTIATSTVSDDGTTFTRGEFA